MKKRSKDGSWYLTNWKNLEDIKDWNKKAAQLGKYVYVLDYSDDGKKIKHLVYKKGKERCYNGREFRDIYIFRINKNKKFKIAIIHIKNIMALNLRKLK